MKNHRFLAQLGGGIMGGSETSLVDILTWATDMMRLSDRPRGIGADEVDAAGPLFAVTV